MSLNKEDSQRVGYKAKIEWYKERFTAITAGKPAIEAPTEFLETTSTPDELIDILGDLQKKAEKLDKRIDTESEGLKVPVDKEKQPDIFKAVAELDEDSKGEYISYDLYRRLVAQQEAALENIELTDIIENVTGDPLSDSLLIQDRISSGLAKYSEIQPPSIPGDDALGRYTNRYLNNIVSWNEHDYKTRQIINFADNYLGMFPDPATTPWRLKRDVRQEFMEAKNLGSFWKMYSEKAENQKDRLLTGFEKLAVLKPDKDIHDLTKRTIKYTNDFLNGVNNVFEFDYAADLICCFVKWGGGLDIKSLKGLRALLQLLQTGLTIDVNDIVHSLTDIINNIFRGLLTHNLVGLVNQIMQRLVDPIKKWINNPDPRWQKIFTCTPVDELINTYVVYALEWVNEWLVSLVQNWYKEIEINRLKGDFKLDLFGEQKNIAIFIKLLDTIIASIEKSAICGTESSPTGEEVQRLMNAYGIGPTESYKYMEEENPNIYNSFNVKTSEEIETVENIDAQTLGGKSVAKTDTQVKTMGTGMTRQKFDECLKRFVPGDVVPITEWFEEAKAKS